MPAKRIATIDAQACCPAILTTHLTDADADGLARSFAALGDPIRLRLLNLIAESGTTCSCDLIAALGRPQPTISYHTKILAEAGLITGTKDGRWVWWQVVPGQITALREALAPT
jgi:ArsR family transcriptional regulator, arsenate/arsenite/antimonite-responsive transcriptional repressor